MHTRDKGITKEIPCMICKKEFLPQKVFQKFCSVPCRTKFHNQENKKKKSST